MTQIIAWKCDITGDIFEDQTLYKKHVRKVSAELRKKAKKDAETQERAAMWNDIRSSITTVDDLCQFIIDKQELFWLDSKESDHAYYGLRGVGKLIRNGRKMPMPKLVTFKEFRLTWSTRVSNSHSCPVGGVTNWGGQTVIDGQPAPRGYPGWHGRVTWVVEFPDGFSGWTPGSALFKGKNIRIHTPSGGAGRSCGENRQEFGYYIEIFAADWPGLYRKEMEKQWIANENRKKQQAWKALGGSPNQVPLIDSLPEGWEPPDVWDLSKFPTY